MYKIEIQNTIQKQIYDEATQQMIDRPLQQIKEEEDHLLNEKIEEVQTKVQQYKDAQLYQIQNGGPGPSAEFEIMKIVNEFQGQFEVVFESNE